MKQLEIGEKLAETIKDIFWSVAPVLMMYVLFKKKGK